MHAAAETASSPTPIRSRIASVVTSLRVTLLVLGVSVLAVDPVTAQTSATAFCTSEMAQTIKNIFTLIQFGGPLIGAVIALGATVLIPAVRNIELKQELKEMRAQAVIWGLIVAPLGTVIVRFLLNNVVSGGTSCGF